MDPFIIFQNSDYLVVDKPAGMATEPPSYQQTLKDWLLVNQYIDAKVWPDSTRAGVVHRLDTDTSGIMIWAKNPQVQEQLKLLWQGRQVKKTYVGLVAGECPESGEVDLAIERDNKNDKMRVAWLNNSSARPAITRYWRLAVGELDNQKVSLIEAHPITGRTHQIRVHMNSLDHSIIGDKLYGNKASTAIAEQLDLSRHFLHAQKISFPWENKEVTYYSPLPTTLEDSLKRVGIIFNPENTRN